MLALYQGRVTRTEKTHNGHWILIHVKGNPKPLAFQTSSFVGDLPHIGDKISVQASEGTFWFFGEHRTLVTVKEDAYFPVEGLSNYVPGRNEVVCGLIMSWLKTNLQVSSDDIYDEAVKRAGNADPRFIGHGFRILSKEKKIHKVGMKNSIRTKKNHARPVAVWELTIR
jgi:hypothetical protein